MNKFSPELGELAKALCQAQALIEGAKEDSTNPFFKSKYADLASVWNACKKALSSHGLSVVQTVQNGDDKVYLVTMLLHTSGQWICSYMPILATKQDPQAFGSAMTYCRRYALAAMVGVCPADDDAESAMQPTRKASIAEIPDAKKRGLLGQIIGTIGKNDKLKTEVLKFYKASDFSVLSVEQLEDCLDRLPPPEVSHAS